LVIKPTYLVPRFLPDLFCLLYSEPECGAGIKVHGLMSDEQSLTWPSVNLRPIDMCRLASSSCLSYKCRLRIVFSRVASPNYEHVARHKRPIESSLIGGSTS
jgi:hypothetical protein